MEKAITRPLIVRRGMPYFLLFSIYAIVNTYLPIMLRTLGFSTAQIGILLGVIEIAGVCAPFFILRYCCYRSSTPILFLLRRSALVFLP